MNKNAYFIQHTSGTPIPNNTARMIVERLLEDRRVAGKE